MDWWTVVFAVIVVVIGALGEFKKQGSSLKTERLMNFFLPMLHPKYHAILSKHSTYYQSLEEKDKRLFEGRLQYFINTKEFYPRGELAYVTAEMVTLIGAAAIQITFGLPRIYLVHFQTILIYPDRFFSETTGQYHKGEVNTQGIIVLGWKPFVDGYKDATDGINLGLHEMAHALKIEDYIRNEEFDFFDQGLMGQFVRYTRREAARIQQGESSFFRNYAATNDHEFFAVVIENFFERPEALYEAHPVLYRITCELLRQDPRNLLA